MTNEFAINILKQYREKPTLVNEIETVEEAAWLDEALDLAIKVLEYDDVKYHEEHGEVIVDKAVWEDANRALEQEHNGCEDCKYETYPIFIIHVVIAVIIMWINGE